MSVVPHLSCTPHNSNLYLANSLSTVRSEPVQAPFLPCTKPHVPFPVLRSYQRIIPGLRQMYPLCIKVSFYGKKLLATRPTPKLEDHHLSAVCDCLFNIHSYPPYWRLFLYLQPKDMPCRGDRVLLTMGSWPCSTLKSVSVGWGSNCPVLLCVLLVLLWVVLTELPFIVICCHYSAENAASFIRCWRRTACCPIIMLTELFTALCGDRSLLAVKIAAVVPNPGMCH